MAQTLRAVFVHGEQTNIDYTPTVDVIAGDVVDLGTFVGIAITPLAANVLGSLAITGVFSFLKGTGAVTLGRRLATHGAGDPGAPGFPVQPESVLA
jgi:predicted RecA/RadA family phage recombinase